MVRPLVEHVDENVLSLFENAVLRKDGDAERGEQLADAVVDLGVDVVRPSRQNDDGPPLLTRFKEDLLPFLVYVRMEFLQSGKPFAQARLDLRARKFVAYQRFFEGTYRRFFVIEVEVGHDKVVACQALVIGF